MAWAAIAVGVVSAGVTMYNNKKNRDAAEEAANKANTLQGIEAAKLDAQKEEYKKMKFENPYENNPYAENVYEDLTVNQQQAQFQAQQGSQQRANIMQSMKGAAGGSGIAALAQSMANQGSLQTQKISASIGMQESANQKLKAQGAQKVQSGEALRQSGEKWVQEKEMDRQSTLLGVQMGASAGANLGAQNAALNQQQVDAAAAASNTQAIGSLAGTVASADYSSLRTTDPDLTSGIDPTNKTGMVTKMDYDINSPTYGQQIQVPAAERFK